MRNDKTEAQEIREVVDWVEKGLKREHGLILSYPFLDALRAQLDNLTQKAGERAVQKNQRELLRLLGLREIW